MKKLILASFLLFFFFIYGTQKSFSQYDDNGYHIDDPKYHAEYNFGKFQYNKMWYPIVDSFQFKLSSKEDYANSFYDTVMIGYSARTKFSDFFFHKSNYAKIDGLYHGYLVKDYQTLATKKEKSIVEFILFIIFLPLLVYFMSDYIKYKRFELSNIWRDMKYFTGSIFVAIAWKDILDWILSNLKIDSDYFPGMFGSNMLFSLVAYILIVSLITKLFVSVEEFLFTKLLTIIFSGFIASIIVAISYKEISHIDVLYILASIIIINFIFKSVKYFTKNLPG